MKILTLYLATILINGEMRVKLNFFRHAIMITDLRADDRCPFHLSLIKIKIDFYFTEMNISQIRMTTRPPTLSFFNRHLHLNLK